ncbi:hypothetical protein E8E14_013513 [Neopestalotiopsis sp. 37M]|nr:hypothetical protein E8E14_013513 [Neopestalotiopsis sp. 37M]
MEPQQTSDDTNLGDADHEIKVMLDDIKKVVNRMAADEKAKLQFSGNLDVTNIQKVFNDYKLQSPRGSAEHRNNYQKYLDRTLNCVQVIGGIVADGASYAGAGTPATTCYNALNFVIKAYQNYKRSYETLAQLLDTCLDSLDRSKIYVETQHGRILQRVACKQLQMFINTCDYALSLRGSRRFRVNAFFKITLFNDDYVQNMLAERKTSNEQELLSGVAYLVNGIDEVREGVENVESAVHESAERVETKVDDVNKSVGDLRIDFGASVDRQNEDRREQKSDNAKKEQRSTLLRALKWQDHQLLETSEGKTPRSAWDSSLSQLLNQRVEKTGSWLEKDDDFLAWAQEETCEQPILYIEGGDGTGKTRLAAHIIRHLREPPKLGDSKARSYVSHYLMETNPKDEKGDIAISVSRSMLWQLAESYQPFLKSTASICKAHGSIDRSYDLWKHLLFNNEEFSNSKSKSIFFFVFDGFTEDSHLDFLNNILEEFNEATRQGTTASHRIRLLITAKKTDLELLKNTDDVGTRTIELGRKNIYDVKLFIDYHMDRVKSPPWGTDTRRRISDALKTSSGGNYREVKGILDQVSGMKDDDEIKQWLKQSHKQTSDPLAMAIKDVDSRCNHDDIQDINEMILWVIHCQSWLHPLQMEGALSLRYRNPIRQSAGFSSQSPRRRKWKTGHLKSKLQEEWCALFEINGSHENGYVRFKNTSIDMARQIIPSRLRSVDGENHLQQNVQPAEVNLVKHYLKSVCPAETYDRFQFDTFFAQKLLKKRDRINRDPDNADLILSARCLTCLVETRDSVTGTLQNYAAEYFGKHLSLAICDGETEFGQDGDPSLADTDLRAQVGALLVRLFSEDYAINSLLQIHGPFVDDEEPSVLVQQGLPFNWKFWMTTDQGVNLLKRFFDDELVLKTVEENPTTKEFVLSLKKNGRAPILESAVTLAVKSFLRADATNREVETAFLFLLAAKATSELQEITSQGDLGAYLWMPTVQRMEEAEAWSKNLASDETPQSHWDASMASILLQFNRNRNRNVTEDHVRARAKKAEDSGNSTWRVLYTLARTTKEDVEAAKTLGRVIEERTKDKNWCNISSNKRILSEICLDLGDRYSTFDGSPRYQDALEMYLTSIERDTSHYERYLEIISCYAKHGSWESIEALVKAILSQSHSGNGTPIGKLVVKDARKGGTFSTSLRQTAERLGEWDLLKTVYDQALKEKLFHLQAFQMRCAYGEALEYAPDQEDECLELWESTFESSALWGSGNLRRIGLDFLVPKMMPIYTKRALAAATGKPNKSLVGTVSPLMIASTSDATIGTLPYSKRIHKLYQRFRYTTAFSTQKVLYFTRYFVLTKDHKSAKESVAELLAQSLDMMTNDDSHDDLQCFWQLQSIFSTFGDIDNANAAMHMMPRREGKWGPGMAKVRKAYRKFRA